MPGSAPLSGVSVLDLSRLLPGPFCTLVLSELGARVDKLEDPQGDYLRNLPPLGPDGVSLRFAALNRNKRSFCLDLKRPEALRALLAAVPAYDVIVESFRPGVLDRLGIGYEVVSRLSPRVVLCSISGYGQTGPLQKRAGHDLNYIALAGLMAPYRGRAPSVPSTQIADLVGGSLWAAIGILSALYAARSTGQGRHLDVSMCEGALALLVTELSEDSDLLRGDRPNYSVYRTLDGRFLAVAPLEPKFWLAFNAAIGRPTSAEELLASPERASSIRDEIQAILATRTRDEWERIFAATDVCVEPVLSRDELESHPQHRARQVLESSPAGPRLRLPFAAHQPSADAPAPTRGEHTDVILREAGLTEGEIAALRACGAAS